MLRFFELIRHKRVHYKRAFTEKAQHLRRCISLRTLPRGRLVPRQPRAIKRTTRTELHHEGISIGKYIYQNIGIKNVALHHESISIAKYIYWNTSTTPTALRRCNIHNGEYIHQNIGTKNMALHYCNIHNGGCIHWDIGTFCYLLIRM